MDNLPTDILKLITLELRPGFMALICKAMDIYDEAWYRDYLIMKYDRYEIVDRDFSFKELYTRSLLEGSIYTYNMNDDEYTNLPIKGIKATPYNSGNYILKFNGDLFSLIDTKLKLLDINVIDIDGFCYIKKSKLCFINDTRSIDLPLLNTPKINIQNITDNNYQFYINHSNHQFYTNDTIYFVYNDGLQYRIYKYYIVDKIIKAYTVARSHNNYITYILTANHDLLVYFNKNLDCAPLIINHVDDLGRNYICINKKYYYFYVYSEKFNFSTDMLVALKYNEETDDADDTYFAQLVSDKQILWVKRDGTIIKKLVADNTIKKFFGDYHRIYVIKH